MMKNNVYLNGIPSINNDGGDYCVLTDYGIEGMQISHQAKTLEQAMSWLLSSGYDSPQAIVKLVRAKLYNLE